MTEPNVSVPKAEYDQLIQSKAHLAIILETADESGYVHGATVNAVRRLLGCPAPVRTADKGSSDES